MEFIYRILLGVAFLLFGFPIGWLLSRLTKEEIEPGQKWFRFLALAGILGSVVALILKNDFLFFGFLFISAVTSMSLRPVSKKKTNK